MKNLPFLFCCLSVLSAFGQSDYYITDSAAIYDVELFDEGEVANAQFCHLNVFDKTKKLSPEVVSAYGFKDGPHYKAFLLDHGTVQEWVFLEVILKGEVSLLAYYTYSSQIFFLEKNNILHLLPEKEGFEDSLSFLVGDFEALEKEFQFTDYEKDDLKHIVSSYNTRNIANRLRAQTGLILGLDYRLRQSLRSLIHNPQDIETPRSFSIGVFREEPLGLGGGNFSLYQEGRYSLTWDGVITLNENQNGVLDVLGNFHQISVPFMIRWKPNIYGLRPYASVGLNGSLLLSSYYYLRYTEFGSNGQRFNSRPEEFPDLFLGDLIMLEFALCGGLGIEIDLMAGKHLLLEFRYSLGRPMDDFQLLNPGDAYFQLFIAFGFL